MPTLLYYAREDVWPVGIVRKSLGDSVRREFEVVGSSFLDRRHASCELRYQHSRKKAESPCRTDVVLKLDAREYIPNPLFILTIVEHMQ